LKEGANSCSGLPGIDKSEIIMISFDLSKGIFYFIEIEIYCRWFKPTAIEYLKKVSWKKQSSLEFSDLAA
jgi:hypothetical protein